MLRAILGLSQAQFACRFGFTLDTVQQYEEGRRCPSGPASTLFRVIEANPEAVVCALRLHKAGWAPLVRPHSRDSSCDAVIDAPDDPKIASFALHSCDLRRTVNGPAGRHGGFDA